MNRKLLLFILLILTILLAADHTERRIPPDNIDKKNSSRDGLEVTPLGGTVTVDDIINTILGENVSVSSVQYTGTPVASGLFQGGVSAGISIEEGVILSCGYAENAIGPNTSSGISGSNGLPGDPDLNNLIPGYFTYDATILEFDFIPQFNGINFNYVFASEEYPEWVFSAFNDVFAFFIDGINVALVPGTNIAVSINNINEFTNAEYYVNNHVGTYNIECDGFTTVLSVEAYVIPWSTHHMKFAIADAGDSILDSWVFLEAESFSSITLEEFSVYVEGGPAQHTNEDEPLDIYVTVSGPNNALFYWWLMNPIWGRAFFIEPRNTAITRIIHYIPLTDWCNGVDQFGFIVFDNFGHNVEFPLGVEVLPVNDPPVNTVPPQISGDFWVGGMVYCDPGEWNDDLDNQYVLPGNESNIEIYYQWQSSENDIDNWQDIAGANESSYQLEAVDADMYIRCQVTAQDDGIGLEDESTTISSNIEFCPMPVNNDFNTLCRTSLRGAYPNPFNPATTISYSLALDGEIEISIYNLKGELVRNLVQGWQSRGVHDIVWDGKDNLARACESGIYFCRFVTREGEFTEKLNLIK